MKGSICKAITLIALAGVAGIVTGTDVSAQIRAGMFGGINYNMMSGSMQDFIPGVEGLLITPNDFSGATGVGAYAGAVGEYAIDDRLGLSLRLSYDQRNVKKESNGSMLRARFAYTTIEPGVGIRLGATPLKLTVGPVMAFKISGTYSYASSASEPAGDVSNAKLANVSQVAFGGRAGVGYDIGLNKAGTMVGVYLTPFVEGNYIFDQMDPLDPASDAMLSTLTVRTGLLVTMLF